MLARAVLPISPTPWAPTTTHGSPLRDTAVDGSFSLMAFQYFFSSASSSELMVSSRSMMHLPVRPDGCVLPRTLGRLLAGMFLPPRDVGAVRRMGRVPGQAALFCTTNRCLSPMALA